jgi:hypothetical protein
MTALKQTRRTVSLNRALYDAARERAYAQGMTLAHYVDACLRAAGVEAPEGEHVGPEVAQKARAGRIAMRSRVLSGWVKR